MKDRPSARATYREFARYYDLIYAWKDYRREAKTVAQLIRAHGRSEGKDVLEVACGTGAYLKYLARDFAVTGVDLNRAMLAEARKKLPKAKLVQADMTRLDLGRQFDAVLCLFSSIGYVGTYPRLVSTLARLADHVKEGGVLIIEPWLPPASFKGGTPHLTVYDGKDIKIARLNTSVVRQGRSIIDFTFAVAEKDKPVRQFTERHALGLFRRQQYVAAIRAAGLTVRPTKLRLMKGRDLYVAVKPRA